jgi:hypothetical protein
MTPNTERLRRVPWTCQWGHFGGTTETGTTCGPTEGPNDPRRSPWVCLHPTVCSTASGLRPGDCEACPFWSVPWS